MMVQIGHILALVLIVTSAACEVKKQQELRQRPPVIEGKVEVVSEKEQPEPVWTEEQSETVRQDFYRLVLESKDDVQTYRLLKTTSGLLKTEGEMIVLMEQTIQNIEKPIKIKRSTGIVLGEPVMAKPNLRQIKEQEARFKKHYSDLAIVYNQKMTELEFKFTKSTGLPPGETEVLPRVFPIR